MSKIAELRELVRILTEEVKSELEDIRDDLRHARDMNCDKIYDLEKRVETLESKSAED